MGMRLSCEAATLTERSTALVVYCGETVREVREQQGLGLVEVATRAETGKSHLAAFETGTRDISLGRVLRIAYTLGLGWIVPLPPAQAAPTSPLAELVTLLQAQPEWTEIFLHILRTPRRCSRRRTR